jgi:S-phase kinase-associated protein 1
MAERRVKLKSSDDEMFEVEESVAFESQAVKNMIEDTGMDHPIPLPNVSSKILAKVIEYCKYHVDNQKASHDKPATPEDEIKAWDLDFVKVDQATLFDLILVNFMFLGTLYAFQVCLWTLCVTILISLRILFQGGGAGILFWNCALGFSSAEETDGPYRLFPV